MLRTRFVACAPVLLQVPLLVLVVEILHDGKSPKPAPNGLPVGPEPPYGTENDPAGADDLPRQPKLLLMLQMMSGKGGALAKLYWRPTRCRG